MEWYRTFPVNVGNCQIGHLFLFASRIIGYLNFDFFSATCKLWRWMINLRWWVWERKTLEQISFDDISCRLKVVGIHSWFLFPDTARITTLASIFYILFLDSERVDTLEFILYSYMRRLRLRFLTRSLWPEVKETYHWAPHPLGIIRLANVRSPRENPSLLPVLSELREFRLRFLTRFLDLKWKRHFTGTHIFFSVLQTVLPNGI